MHVDAERAAVGPVHERGRLTVDPEQRGVSGTLVEAGQGRQQPERVGMARRGEEGVDGCALDAPAGVEDDDPVGEIHRKPEMRSLLRRTALETVAVAAATHCARVAPHCEGSSPCMRRTNSAASCGWADW